MDLDSKEQVEKNNAPTIQYKYKIITKTPIGKGGFATVYQAVDKLNNVYAIKCISLEKLKKYNSQNTDKFLLELDISMKMKHPNIVKSHEVFKTNKNWYIVCEYCDNGTLANIIKSLGFDNMEREMVCRRYLTQLKNSLKYLYRNNIVHRDLKPTNILLSGKYPHDTLKLADFGFSRYFESKKDEDIENSQTENEFMMTSFCGTPLYMAPELLSNRKYTNKADLWSFGVIMYEMLYGVNPYNFPKSLNNLLDLIKTQEITFNNIYSNECMNLVKSLLQVDVQKRINWEDFFKHPWFDKKIPSGFSYESLCGSIENLTNLVHNAPSPNSSDSNTENKFPKPQSKEDTNKSVYDVNVNYELNHTEIPENQIQKYNDNEEFDVINKDEIGPCDYNTYKEEETYGFLKILSNSVYNMFGVKKRDSFS
jgi:serine/threonine-protein kinase ULK/ATG1